MCVLAARIGQESQSKEMTTLVCTSDSLQLPYGARDEVDTCDIACDKAHFFADVLYITAGNVLKRNFKQDHHE